jgi:hypothetical protein
VAGPTTLAAPSGILVVVGWAVGLPVETVVELARTGLELGTNDGFQVDEPTVVEVVFSPMLMEELLVVVVAGAVEVLELVEVEVAGGGVCETRPPVTV